ncbi:hypothetical protein H9X87_00885 [Pseudoflavonifractor capillosus]|jgi:hypothetical protein|uniref:hypothetical protein n=1 Tax=Pseudoflavonifractor TaxID=1017280 RepID=UPI00117A8A98|nr:MULTISPECIES: hypothetical protein [Pseudoflavonifractor]MBM6693330.1 hypothetical protein [Pseudoflavonifractor capillosus]
MFITIYTKEMRIYMRLGKKSYHQNNPKRNQHKRHSFITSDFRPTTSLRNAEVSVSHSSPTIRTSSTTPGFKIVSTSSQNKKPRYIVFQHNAELYVGRQSGKTLRDITRFTAETPAQLAGSEVVIKRKGMSRVEVASIVNAMSNPNMDTYDS